MALAPFWFLCSILHSILNSVLFIKVFTIFMVFVFIIKSQALVYVFFLPFKESSLLFEVLVRLSHLIIDDSKSQIHHEERAEEDHKHKVEEGAWVSRVHRQSHHECPSLQGHALKYSQEGHEKVVK